MKKIGCGSLLLLGLAVGSSLTAHDVTPSPEMLMDDKKGMSVLFEGTLSPDGARAVAWTLRRSPQAKSVDWSTWKAGESFSFLSSYVGDPDDPAAAYHVVDGIIDLRAKRFIELPSASPDWPNKNHSYLKAAWSPEGRYVWVVNIGRFSTNNFWQVCFNSSVPVVLDLTQRLNEKVQELVHQAKKPDADQYVTFFDPPDPASGVIAGSVSIPFTSDIPKSEDENSEVKGLIVISLPEGKMISAKVEPAVTK